MSTQFAGASETLFLERQHSEEEGQNRHNERRQVAQERNRPKYVTLSTGSELQVFGFAHSFFYVKEDVEGCHERHAECYVES
jgi:hypothetical protein